MAGGVSQTPAYLSCKSEDDVKAIFKKQIDVFVQKNVDFLIAEVKRHQKAEERATSSNGVTVYYFILSLFQLKHSFQRAKLTFPSSCFLLAVL